MVAAFLLTGCSGGSTPSTTPVAGIASSGGGHSTALSKSPAVSVEDARPLLRPDASDEDYARLYRHFYDCLVKHGIPRTVSKAMGKVAYDEENPHDKAALAACRSVEPESTANREKRQDPAAYADDNRQVIKCLRAHHVPIEVDSSGVWGLKVGAEGGDPMRACVRLAFAD